MWFSLWTNGCECYESESVQCVSQSMSLNHSIKSKPSHGLSQVSQSHHSYQLVDLNMSRTLSLPRLLAASVSLIAWWGIVVSTSLHNVTIPLRLPTELLRYITGSLRYVTRCQQSCQIVHNALKYLKFSKNIPCFPDLLSLMQGICFILLFCFFL